MWSGFSYPTPIPPWVPPLISLKLVGIVDEKYFQGLLGDVKDSTNLTTNCFPEIVGTIFRCIPKSVSRFTYILVFFIAQTDMEAYSP